MNVISYINGDTHSTDFPDCSARPLAAFVQVCNDLLAGPDGYLSPKTAYWRLNSASRPWEPPMSPILSSTHGWPNC
jgi:hypothetical protein